MQEPLTEDRIKTMSPDELMEEGLGLISRGMFRLGDKSLQNKPMEAYEQGMTLVSIIRDMAFSFRRLGEKVEPSGG
jgi:hypothetical protein